MKLQLSRALSVSSVYDTAIYELKDSDLISMQIFQYTNKP